MITQRADFGGIWWPDYDHKPEACFAKVMRRLSDTQVSANLCAQHRVCVQAGGHAGLWAQELSKRFDRVWTFEPEQALYACLLRNVGKNMKIVPSGAALGSFEGTVKMTPHPSAGSWSVQADGTVPVRQVTIDSLNLMFCDLIVLDIEGYEVEALRGGEDTISRCRPVIHVEMGAKSRDGIARELRRMGYEFKIRTHGDEIYVPRC